MKSKITPDNIFKIDDNRKIIISVGELKKQFDAEYEKRYSDIHTATIRDIAPQLMSVVLYTLENVYGFKQKRLSNFIDECSFYYSLMETGVMNKKFDCIDLINHFRDEYNIELEYLNITDEQEKK